MYGLHFAGLSRRGAFESGGNLPTTACWRGTRAGGANALAGRHDSLHAKDEFCEAMCTNLIELTSFPSWWPRIVVKNFGLLAYPDMKSLDLIGPLDVFGMANTSMSGKPPYQVGREHRVQRGLRIHHGEAS